jgi:hypothetical protein
VVHKLSNLSFTSTNKLCGLFAATLLLLGTSAFAQQSGYSWWLDYWTSKGYNLTAASNYCVGMSDPGMICTFAFGERGESIYIVRSTCQYVQTYGSAECTEATAERYSSRFARPCIGVSDNKGYCIAGLVRRGLSPNIAANRCPI